MMSWPGSCVPRATPAIIWRIAAARRPRATGTQPMRSAYQPRIGAQTSSRFMMNFGRGTALMMIRMSRKDWCLAAISTSSCGGVPRTSLRMPTIQRAVHSTQRT